MGCGPFNDLMRDAAQRLGAPPTTDLAAAGLAVRSHQLHIRDTLAEGLAGQGRIQACLDVACRIVEESAASSDAKVRRTAARLAIDICKLAEQVSRASEGDAAPTTINVQNNTFNISPAKQQQLAAWADVCPTDRSATAQPQATVPGAEEQKPNKPAEPEASGPADLADRDAWSSDELNNCLDSNQIDDSPLDSIDRAVDSSEGGGGTEPTGVPRNSRVVPSENVQNSKKELPPLV